MLSQSLGCSVVGLKYYVSSEIILTIGKSSTVAAFLKSAAPYRKYTVIVAETAPSSVFLVSF